MIKFQRFGDFHSATYHHSAPKMFEIPSYSHRPVELDGKCFSVDWTLNHNIIYLFIKGLLFGFAWNICTFDITVPS